ncbi:hypothetical protein FKN04_12445 [Bacillus glycinifermentans]|uniref:hypothetical protein n=1 Tax=Bacillus glycinifermentans TaxID=1664069 RepID=UPI001583A0F4|nr:hypothetical protein [Bacillus glycinifermentans]NUJ17390.1 hypothetical protein [Bacillus glycinifermentans]
MRSYTNKDGELITVSEEHLSTAVRIKKELQNASPSRRASWNQLVKLMEKEGFYDAENSESYRCMIKAYQKSIGELPDVQKHADMIAAGKLESIKELVGEMAYEKRENQKYLTQINKGKRELIDFGIIAEQIGIAFKSYDFASLKLENTPLPSSNKKMIVGLSDLHIGALVDTSINKYNFNIALQRLSVYASIIIREAKINNITDLHIVNLGDVIEHSSMRFNQGYKVEFPFSDQIVQASDLIIKFLMFLSKEGFNITYAGIAGNHDRITDKDKNIDGDHVVKPINYAIKSFIHNSGIKNISFDEADDYEYSLGINGKNIKFVHGDLDSLKDEILAKHSNNDGVLYDMIVMGHYHSFRDIEVGLDKRIVVFGSLKGSDDYSKNKLRKLSSPSQGIIIIDKNGDVEVKRIKVG